MKKNILLTISLISLSAVSFAQKDTTLNRTVIVENNYNPEVMDASKINVLPKVDDFRAPKSEIRYATVATPYTSYSNGLLDFEIAEPQKESYKNGLVRAGLGNFGNVDIYAKYTLNLNPNDRLSFNGAVYGRDGKLKDWNYHDWYSRFYTSTIDADYAHYFKNYLLTVGGKFKSQVFNYINHEGLDKQHNTIADANASIRSLNNDKPLSFYAQLGYRSFAQKYALGELKQGSQGNLYLNGDVWAEMSDNSNIGIEFKFDNLTYSSKEFKGVTTLRMNPYYNIQGEDWILRIGAHSDYQTGLSNKVHFAPDLYAQYRIANGYVIYAKAGGGVELNDFNRLNTLSPYFIMNRQYETTATLLDSKIGVKASPINEMWFHLFAGYRSNKNDLSYMLTGEPAYVQFYQDKSSSVYGGGEFRYGFKDIFDVNVKAIYYKWSSSSDNEADFIASKPELTFDIDMKYKVIKNLYLNGGFSYVKRVENKNQLINTRYLYKDYKNLYLGAQYEIFNNISVYAKINNILNSKNFREDCYPADKFNFVGGLSFKF